MPADRVPPLNGRAGLGWALRPEPADQPLPVVCRCPGPPRPRDSSDPRIDPDGTPGWATMNFSLTWQARETLELGLRLENLADKQYREHGSGIDAAGRNLGLWVNARF